MSGSVSSMFDRLQAAPLDLQKLAVEWPVGLTFALPPSATIVVAGAFEGKLIDLLATVYDDYDRIVGFEPHVPSAAVAVDRLHGRRNIDIYPYGLGTKDMDVVLHEAGTVMGGLWGRPEADDPVVELRDAARILDTMTQIDLLVLNMEGSEWEVIPRLASLYRARKIKRLAVQFHHDVGNSSAWAIIQYMLDNYYMRTYDDLPRWGVWTLR